MIENNISANRQFILNDEQSVALTKLRDWWYGYRYSRNFEISGAAGTGKTTLIKYLIQQIGLNINNVLFLAYVGKAALVMARNGLRAQTIHSAIYDVHKEPKRNKNDVLMRYEDGRIIYDLKFVRKPVLPQEIQLIVIDEASMVPENIGREIESFNIPIIATGDLNQLPPVFGNSYFLRHPDVILKKIMRQSDESPIPYFAKDILDGKWFGECTIGNKIFIKNRYKIPKEELNEVFSSNDIIICGTNKTRDALNRYIREEIYNITDPEPVVGDKLICRRNDWNRCINNNFFLINGMIGYVDDIDIEYFKKSYIKLDFKPDFLENYLFMNVLLDRKYFHMPYEKKLNYFSDYNLFELGYAITCHLAQGSQYNDVCIVLDSYIWNNKKFRKQWLYTAVTRAINSITILI